MKNLVLASLLVLSVVAHAAPVRLAVPVNEVIIPVDPSVLPVNDIDIRAVNGTDIRGKPNVILADGLPSRLEKPAALVPSDLPLSL